MSALTPRDLKDITDLVSRKLEMYLNIDERERKFDPEGCYRVSPRMHKYDVMYRLLESTEFEKSLKTTSTTPRSRSRNNQSNDRKEKTPRSRSRKNQSEKRNEISQRSRPNNEESKLKDEKPRSRSKSAKTPRGQQAIQSKTRPKSSTHNEMNSKSTQRKPATSKSAQDSFSKRYQYRPIAIKTPRSTNKMVGAKQTRRLELYANEVYDNHPVQELQEIHNVCPRIPNNGKVQNYTKHVGAALNTKNYMDFYLKTGLDGSKASPRRTQREITYKGSMSPATTSRCSGDSNYSSNSPQVDISRAVVTFQSPPSSGSSEATYKVINYREDTNPHSSSVTSSEAEQSQLGDDVILAPYGVMSSPRRPDDVSIKQQPEDVILSEQTTNGYTGHIQKSPRGSGNPGDRCKSRLGRKSSSLNINYNSDSEDLSISSSDNEPHVDKDTSTRTNSPASTQESLETPSSYQEIDSSDSSNSSVLRYYRLSTGEVYSPRRTKSPRAGKSAVQLDDEKRQRQSRNTLTPRKSPERPKRGTSAHKARPNFDDSSSSVSSSCSPRYTLLRPSSRLLKRSSIRSDSVSEESIDSPRSSQQFQPQRSHRPKTSVRRSRDKQLIDLNLTAVLNREKSEMSVTGTGDDDVFVDEGSDEFHRASEDAASTQSRGICDESDNESNHALSKEEYYMLGKNGTAALPATIVPDRRFSPVSPTASPRFLKSPDSTEKNDVTTYSTTETVPLPERNVSFNSPESLTKDADTPRGEENNLDPDFEIPTGPQNVSNVDEEIPKSSESDTQESQVSGSDIEYLSRGSDGYHKDGRGNGRKRSATRRPPSRGSQWEDESPKLNFSTPRNLPGNDPDERGDYQFLPENRGNFNEKGYSEGEPETYIITGYENAKNTTEPQKTSQEPREGIPPKSRQKTVQHTAASPLSNESRGETSSPVAVNPGHLSQAEIYKAISHLKEVEIDLNKDIDSGPSTTETSSSSSEDVKHYNFLLGSDASPSEVARGGFVPSCPATQSEMSVIIKPYQEPSQLQTSLVYDMQEKTDEFRGRVDAEELAADDKENVLGRGLSRAASVTSTLSWSDKYGTGAKSHPNDKGSEISASPANNQDVKKETTEDVPKEESVSTAGQNTATTSQRGMLDEDVLKNLQHFYKREDSQDEPSSKYQLPDINIEEIMSQLEYLVKAKQMHLDKSSLNTGDEFSCVRGGDGDIEESSDQTKNEVEPQQQYSQLIQNLIQTAPAMSSEQVSSSGSISSESDTSTTTDTNVKSSSSEKDRSAKYPRSPKITTKAIVYKEETKFSSSDGEQSGALQPRTLTTRAIVHNEDTTATSTSSVDATDAADGGKIKLHQSSFLETALGISGDVTECMVKPKQEKTHLTEKDIIVLKSPCLAVAKTEVGQILDCKSAVSSPKKVNKKVLERGKLETKRPRSAAVRSSKSRSSSRRRRSSGVYLSA